MVLSSGPFASLEDFYRRSSPSMVEARDAVLSGSLDGLPGAAGGRALTRAQALWILHRLRSRPEPELFPNDWDLPACLRT
jgi:hypothetical protein